MEHSRSNRSSRPRRVSTFVTLLAALLAPVAHGDAQGDLQRNQVQTTMSPSYAPGDVVEVEWNGQWFRARVLSVEPSGECRIRYDGWSDSWDETVVPARVRTFANRGRRRREYATPPPPPVVVGPWTPPPPTVVVQPAPTPVVLPAPAPVVLPAPVPTQPPSPNLVVNGGFEMPGLATGSWQNLPQIPGWFTTFGRGFEVQAGVAGAPFEGRQLLELDGDAPSGIGQDLATAPGRTYEVRVAFSARPGTNADDNRIVVLWDGRVLGRLVADGTGHPQTSWTVASFFVTASSGRARLELRDEGVPNSLGSYVDDIRVTPVQ